jgi:hypothetical protein
MDNDHFDENLQSELPESRTLTFSMSYDTAVLFAESFLFPCQEAILFIEFSSAVHSTEKSRSVMCPKNSPVFESSSSSSTSSEAPTETSGTNDVATTQRVVCGVI